MRVLGIAILIIGLVCVPASAKWVNPLKLEKGSSYVLSSATTLLPSRKRPIPMKDFEKIKKIPRNGIVKIIKALEVKGEILYFVKASDRKNNYIGRGWISGVTLMSQQLHKIVKKKGNNKDVQRMMRTIWGDR